jgi:hypothetical protein
MDGVRVSNEGLQALAAECATVSAQLADGSPSPATGPISQATSTAVAGGYAALRAVASVLATRVQATGLKLSTAGIGYTASDDDASRRLAALGQSLEV